MAKDKNAMKNLTRGGQITFHNIRMFLQINKVVVHLIVVSTLLLSALFIYLLTPNDVLLGTRYYYYAEILKAFGNTSRVFMIHYHGESIPSNATSVLSQPFFQDAKNSFWLHILGEVGVACIISFFISSFFIRWLTKRGAEQNSSEYIRGARLMEVDKVAKLIRDDEAASDIAIDILPLIRNTETQHMLVHGTTGAGKGQLIAKILDSLRARGDRVIIYDKGCTFTSKFFNEKTDKILNAFDKRCENWDLWREAITQPDFENMAESLIAEQADIDPFWVNAARTIFASVAFKMRHDKDRSIDKLFNLILSAELKELEKYLAGTEAATLASDKIEKTAISIRSTITTFLKPLKYLKGLDKEGKEVFSIRDWILDESKSGWLFINSNAAQHAALKPLISMWFSMASIAMLSLTENYNRRIWFVVDELPSLHRLPQLPETLAEARKFGGCFIVGLQSYAQLRKRYGENAAKEMSDLFNSRFFFRSASSDMAKWVSAELGNEEYDEVRENYSYGANDIRDGISYGRQRVTRPIVDAAQITALKDLEYFARFPGKYPVAHGHLDLVIRQQVALGFDLRNFVEPESVEVKQEEAKTEEDSDVKRTSKKKKVEITDYEMDEDGNPIEKSKEIKKGETGYLDLELSSNNI